MKGLLGGRLSLAKGLTKRAMALAQTSPPGKKRWPMRRREVNGRRGEWAGWGSCLYRSSGEATGLNRSNPDHWEESVHSSILIVYMSNSKSKSVSQALPGSPKDPNLGRSHCLKDLARIYSIKMLNLFHRKTHSQKFSKRQIPVALFHSSISMNWPFQKEKEEIRTTNNFIVRKRLCICSSY